MQKFKIRHIFAGGNTSHGFFSYFNYIINLSDANRLYILKGGPGTGKSTFMKYIGSEAMNHDYDVEYFHCSSDSNSLDGVSIPSLKIAMVDGTAPHTIDPEYPGVVDEIINLGEYWDKNKLKNYRDRVLRERKEIKLNFAGAYRYLGAAAVIYQDTEIINKKYMDNRKLNKITFELIEDLFFSSENPKTGNEEMLKKEGTVRRLFASAITPDGVINYLDSILNTSRIYGLVGDPGMGINILLEKIKEESTARGYDVECFYCGLIPNKLEHIVIPELDISLTTINKYHSTKLTIDKYFNFEDFSKKVTMEVCGNDVIENEKQIDLLIKRAVKSIIKAKSIHFEMEKYYSPAMDFDRLMICKERVKNEIGLF
ncbi:MAG TPA: ATPase [Clostridiales bacterium]|nr:ATPase [Clostridiales bacterium]